MPNAAVEPVVLLTAHIGSDGTLLRLARAGGARGFVVAATGSGNTHPDLLAAATEAMAAGLPVVLTSRCPAGGIDPAYAFPGGGATWLRAGAISAGTLAPPKARLALALGLGAGRDRSGLASLFSGPGAAPGPTASPHATREPEGR
jgi:L-asparaginase